VKFIHPHTRRLQPHSKREMDLLWTSQPTLPSTWVMSHIVSPVEVLEFRTSPILILLLCGLKNYCIVNAAFSRGRFLIINLIE
jgi:hypothetical protein